MNTTCRRTGMAVAALEQLRSDFDARINELEDRLVLTLPSHFEFDRAQVRSVDEPLLNRFAATVRNHMSAGPVTPGGRRRSRDHGPLSRA